MLTKNIINNYLEINNKEHIKELLYLKNKYKFLKKYKGKKILLIDKEPNYNNFNICQTIMLFSQIGDIDCYYYYFKYSEVDKKINFLINGKTKLVGESNYNAIYNSLKKLNSGKILKKLFDNEIKLYKNNNINFDLVICNGRGFVKDYDEVLKKINYRDIFYFYKPDSGGFFLEYKELIKNKSFLKFFKELINYEKNILDKDNSFDVFKNGGYIFFSSILSKFYNIENNNKKYDIIIAGSYRARDFDIIRKLLEKNENYKILIITETNEDINDIKNKLYPYKVDIIINKFSYSNMYKLVSLGKIYLNCSKYGSFSNGITGMLIPASSKTLILSYKNPFFSKIINDGYNGFLYSSFEELYYKLNYILNLEKNEYNKICNNKLKDFLEGVTIENVLIENVFPKLF